MSENFLQNYFIQAQLEIRIAILAIKNLPRIQSFFWVFLFVGLSQVPLKLHSSTKKRVLGSITHTFFMNIGF
jgi:hypothetical protein